MFIIVLLGTAILKTNIGICVTIPPLAESDLTRKYTNELAYFDIPSNSLPEQCFLVTEFKTAPLLPMTSNPYITNDPAIIELLSGKSNKAHIVKAIIRVLYADRTPGREVGITGYILSSSSEARQVLKKGVLYKDSMVITIWLDSKESEPCRSAIIKHLVYEGFAKSN